MSLAEIMTELPQLTREQRAGILGRIAELDGEVWLDPEVTPSQRAEIDRRLVEIGQGGTQWSAWPEERARIERYLREDVPAEYFANKLVAGVRPTGSTARLSVRQPWLRLFSL